MAADLKAPEKPEAMIFLPVAGLPPEAVRAGKTLGADDPLDDHVRSAVEVLTALAEVRAPGASADRIARAAGALAAAVGTHSQARARAVNRVRARLGIGLPKPLPKPVPRGRPRRPAAPIHQLPTSRAPHLPVRRWGVFGRAIRRLLAPFFDQDR